MRLDALAAEIAGARIVGDAAVEVGSLAYDSRKVGPGTLFFCVPGEKVDGHEFGAAAVEAGAVALVVERELDVDVAQVVVAGCAGGYGAVGGSVLGGSDGGAAGRWGDGDEWEDDYGVPAPGDPGGGGRPVRVAGDGAAGGRWGGGGG